MDAFKIIQHFFTRMNCQDCNEAFSIEDVELLRRQDALYVVNVFCHKCHSPNGVALVGVDSGNFDSLDDADLEDADFDLEFQEDDETLESLGSAFVPVNEDFFKKLGTSLQSSQGKMAAIPEEMLMQLLAQAGAMMGQSKQKRKSRFKDPELTKEERKRLSQYAPISQNDVLDAHKFFHNLDSDWMRFIPEEMRQPQIELHTESPVEPDVQPHLPHDPPETTP